MSELHPPVYFLRHGQTDWNLEGLIQGTIDTPLNDTGLAQAKALGRALADVPGLARGFQFFVSPLRRARQTMDHIASALGLAADGIGVAADLRELGFGVWEGKPFWELKASSDYPADGRSRYSWRPEDGESYADGRERMGRWLDRLRGPAVVVSHGAIGRCLLAHLCDLAPHEVVNLEMPQGRYCRIEGGHATWFDAMEIAA